MIYLQAGCTCDGCFTKLVYAATYNISEEYRSNDPEDKKMISVLNINPPFGWAWEDGRLFCRSCLDPE